ncbi:MAG TPA: hypothetical protein VM307_02210 [Egibacteraceae bacterium]|nr:hypothetical protein [Egibacteraceae bacterium]
MATMQVDVVSAEEQLFSGEASEFYARSLEGEIGILPGHQPILLMLQPGSAVRVKTAGGQESFDVPSGGFLEFRDNHLIVLAEATDSE